MVGVGFYFCRSRRQVTDSIQEVADITLADYKQSTHCWVIPADSAALTPEPRPVENDLRHILLRGEGRERVIFSPIIGENLRPR